jgi:hypothetical protein
VTIAIAAGRLQLVLEPRTCGSDGAFTLAEPDDGGRAAVSANTTPGIK